MRAPAIAATVILVGIVVTGVALLCLATAGAMLAPLGWPFELFSHFRLQYFVAGVALAATALLLRQRAAAFVAVAAAIMNSFNPDGTSGLSTAAADAECVGPPLTVVTVNLRYDNRDHDRLLAWLDEHPADLVVAQEVTMAWASTLARLPGVRFGAVRTREDPYGLALLSRQPLGTLAWVELAGDGVPMVEATFDFHGQAVRVLGLHTHWPIVPATLDARDRDMHHAARRVSSDGLPGIVAGDLNTSPDAPAFARLLREGGLRDTFEGAGWNPTWMASFWPLAIRIDHVLATPSFCVADREVGPDVGSDHRPVRVTLRLRSAADRAPT